MWARVKELARRARQERRAAVLADKQLEEECLGAVDAEDVLSRRQCLAECGLWRGVVHSCPALVMTTTATSAAEKASPVLHDFPPFKQEHVFFHIRHS